jgi:hypothetical protein
MGKKGTKSSPRKRRVEVALGNAAPGGRLCLLLDGDPDAPARLIERQGATASWRVRTIDGKVMAIAPPSELWGPSFVALTWSGEVVRVDTGETEVITGGGNYHGDAPYRGNLEELVFDGDAAIAIGRGGQVLARGDRGWSPVGPGVPVPDHPADTLCFVAGVSQVRPRRRVFGGLSVAGNSADQEAIDKAFASGDAAEFARLMLAGNRPDVGALYLLEDGAWRSVQPPGAGFVAELACPDGERVFVLTVAGTLFATTTFESFAQITDRDNLVTMCVHDGRMIAATDHEVLTIDGDVATPLAGAVPRTPGSTIAVSATDDAVYLIRSTCVLELADGRWSKIELPYAEELVLYQ